MKLKLFVVIGITDNLDKISNMNIAMVTILF